MDNTIKELKEMNKTLASIRNFIIAEAQLMKSMNLELETIKREIMKFKKEAKK